MQLTAELDQRIEFGSHAFDYCLRARSDTAALRRRLNDLDADRFILVTDRDLPPKHVARIYELLLLSAPTGVYSITSQERAKTLAAVEELAGAALRDGATRRSVVVALGGGLAGNIAGLLAHLFLRGSRLIHMPTTLLAMSDSVLSLKQAVNSSEGKNHLGAFHPPEFVWADLNLLKTLPPDEIRSALCEMVKNILAIEPGRYDWAMARLRPDAGYSIWELSDFIALCIGAKQRVMRNDPRETGPGLALEYGHTIGHAIEVLAPGGLPHGLAVGLGMLAAARISAEMGYLSASGEHAHRLLLARAGAPMVLHHRIPPRDVLAATHKDNKRGYRMPVPGTVDMILLDSLGTLHTEGGSRLTQVPDKMAARAVESVMPALPVRPRLCEMA
jgi:3-dehydroquinate synthase/2-deoxy-scyllo-inosose synthase